MRAPWCLLIALLVPQAALSQASTDLVPRSLIVPTYGHPGLAARVVMEVENDGVLDAAGFVVSVSLGTMPIPPIIAQTPPMTLLARTSTVIVLAVVIPPGTPLGPSSMAIFVDASSVVSELRETNNFRAAQITIADAAADLVATIDDAPAAVDAGQTMRVDSTLRNIGVIDAPDSVTSYSLRDPSGVDIPLGASMQPAVAAGGSAFVSATIGIPIDVPPGSYTLVLTVDARQAVAELEEGNNESAGRTIEVGIPELRIVTRGLRTGQVGQPYSHLLAATRSPLPLEWTLLGGGFPGLTLDATSGLLSGRPQTPGVFMVVVSVRSGLLTATETFPLTIEAVDLRLDAEPAHVLVLGRSSELRLGALGGVPPYRFRLLSPEPPGLLLDLSGALRGIPAQLGTFILRVQVEDTRNAVAEGMVGLTVVDAPEELVIATAALPDARVGDDYCAAGLVRLTALGGVAPLTWRIDEGTLPAGMFFESVGVLCGTPTEAGEHPLVIRVTDREGSTDGEAFTLLVRDVEAPMPSPTPPPALGLEEVEPSGCGCTTGAAGGDAGAVLSAWGLISIWAGARRRRRGPS